MTNTTRNIALTTCVLVIAQVATSFGQTGSHEFRGIPLNEGTRLDSLAFDRVNTPYWIDIRDDFNRDGLLGLSEVDGDQVGFVPPTGFGDAPDGPLTGGAADAHGRWMPEHGDYITSSAGGGRVQRATNDTREVACLPWHVIAGLGDRYMIEMDAVVAAGESVTLGYFGDITQTGSAQGLNGELGQLILEVERDIATPEEVTWTVEWDFNGNRQRVVSSTTAAVDDELRLQLAWEDLEGSDNDLFDAWLETSSGNRRLAMGNMGVEIDVFGAGFEIEGLNSYITGFAAAVPEPTAATSSIASLLCFGLLGLLRRKGSC